MAINTNLLQRASDRRLFLATAILFPLIVLSGFYKSYYLRAFFDVSPIPNSLVHLHAIVMSLWVVYFTLQAVLIRSKNVKLHMTMGMAGIGLAALVVVVGFATAYDSQLVRGMTVPGIHPHRFFAVTTFDMLLFIILFTAAISYRKRPAEHKSLMLLTAVNFMPAAVARIPLVPENYALFWSYVIPDILAIAAFGWYTWKRGTITKVFAIALVLLIASHPLRFFIAGTDAWLQFIGWLAS